MHHRFLQEGKPGFTMRSGSSYSTWWNGGLRTTAYFQNIIGLLTEIIGNPTPMQIPPVEGMILPRADLPAPIEPQVWHFRQSIDYSVTANYSVLDLASRYKDEFLYNIYKMGSNQIARGSQDHWTISEEDMARLDCGDGARPRRTGCGARRTRRSRRRGGTPAARRLPRPTPAPAAADAAARRLSLATYNSVMKDPAHRDPRVFIVTADQADFATATKFINALRYIGVEVDQATAPLTANGKTYPAGTFVVKTAQAGRAHVLDMFEPQDHPNDMDERGIPRRPYDNAGWTLAYQMGVKFDRVFDDVTGAFKRVEGLAAPLPGKIAGAAAAGYLLSPAENDAFTVANRVLKAGGDVYRLAAPMSANGHTYPAGSLYVAASAAATPIVQKGAQELGVNLDATSDRQGAGATKIAARRIALWDTPTGSMPSGWTRFVLERFEFPFTVVCGAGFDDTALRSKYDVILLPSGGGFRAGGGFGGRGGGGRGGGGGDEPVPVPGAGAEAGSGSAQPLPGDDRYRQRRRGGSQRQEIRRGGRRRRGRGHGGARRGRHVRVAHLGLSRRAPAGPARARAVGGQVLRAGLGPACRRRSHGAVGRRRRESHRRVLRQQPGLPPRARRHRERRAAGDVVRHGEPAAQRLGLGPELSRRRARRRSRRPWARGSCLRSARRSRSAASRTRRSSSSSTRSIHRAVSNLAGGAGASPHSFRSERTSTAGAAR